MIQEAYVSFETAKLLKEKGFDEIVEYAYGITESHPKGDGLLCMGNRNSDNFGCAYSRPTLQMAMKWLREVHNLCLFVIPATIDNILRPGYAIYPMCDNKWEWCASKNDGSKATFGCDINKDYCDSYEQACEVAIKYCLEHLI